MEYKRYVDATSDLVCLVARLANRQRVILCGNTRPKQLQVMELGKRNTFLRRIQGTFQILGFSVWKTAFSNRQLTLENNG